MPNTYTQIYIHYVFATKLRLRLLDENMQQELYRYTTGIIRDLNCYLQCIGGMEDHIHILVGLHPTISVSEFAEKLKANSSKFINEKGWVLGKFSWQTGYGAFSVSQSSLEKVRNYINNQVRHHQHRSFSDEYEELLSKYNINYDKRYLFQPTMEE